MPPKLTTQQFIEKARAVHGERYSYEQVEYVGCYDSVKIICPQHGPFEKKPFKHLYGQGCPTCGYDTGIQKLRSNTSSFVEKAHAIHGERYDYSKAQYSTNHKKLTIICSIHGDFEQTAADHLSGKGCSQCKGVAISNALRKDISGFVRDARAVHGERYDYSLVEYNGTFNKVLIRCYEHGEFRQTPTRHLRGTGCQKCAYQALSVLHTGKNVYISPEARIAGSATKVANAKAKFAERAKKVHNGKYDYSRSQYVAAKKPVAVICPEHGEFVASTADNHLRGKGCPECGKAGWSRSAWSSAQKGRKATLYLVELHAKGELFYKVGITFCGVSGRFRQGRCPYTTRTIALFKSDDAGKVYDLEHDLHRQFKHLKYQPKIPFAGQTECFSSAALILSALPKETIFRNRPAN